VTLQKPLRLGWRGYEFKNLSTGISVRDEESERGEITRGSSRPIVLVGRTEERNIGTLGQNEINKLFPKLNTRYFVSVTRSLSIDNRTVKVESNRIEITILPQSRYDSLLIAELTKLGGSLYPRDNSDISLFSGSNLSFELNDSALTILRKYRNSVYFPYFVAYISRNHTPSVGPNFRGKNDEFLLDFLNNCEREFANADKNLSVTHMTRMGSRYLGRRYDDSVLRDIGLKYQKRLSEKFPRESSEKTGKKQGIRTKFHAVDVLISPEMMNRFQKREAQETNTHNEKQ
jgi:hypothetical protein